MVLTDLVSMDLLSAYYVLSPRDTEVAEVYLVLPAGDLQWGDKSGHK